MMPSDTNVRVLFFQHLKTQLPAHLSMVDEIAAILNISNDSAYRRIRGEKPIDLEEIYKLFSHFKTSMDQLLQLQQNTFIFSGLLKGKNIENAFEDWLKEVQFILEQMDPFEKKHIYFLMKDIPPFVHFQVPELAAFRSFFYMKSIIQDDKLKGVKFSLEDAPYDKFAGSFKKIGTLYNHIPITEIWNVETLNSTLNQINFYREAGSFVNKEDVVTLYEKVEALINHIEKQAELGLKFNIGEMPGPHAVTYRMFMNDLILGNNTLLAELGEARITYINHSVIYFIATRNADFNNAMLANFENLMKKSTMISTIGEKDRASFFNRLRHNIQQYAAR
jgi:hypothetical protein